MFSPLPDSRHVRTGARRTLSLNFSKDLEWKKTRILHSTTNEGRTVSLLELFNQFGCRPLADQQPLSETPGKIRKRQSPSRLAMGGGG